MVGLEGQYDISRLQLGLTRELERDVQNLEIRLGMGKDSCNRGLESKIVGGDISNNFDFIRSGNNGCGDRNTTKCKRSTISSKSRFSFEESLISSLDETRKINCRKSFAVNREKDLAA